MVLGFIKNGQLLALDDVFPLQVQLQSVGRLLQVKIVIRQQARQGGFPALTRAHQSDRRVLRQAPANFELECLLRSFLHFRSLFLKHKNEDVKTLYNRSAF